MSWLEGLGRDGCLLAVGQLYGDKSIRLKNLATDHSESGSWPEHSNLNQIVPKVCDVLCAGP